jgi:hypothetical protein
MRKRTVEVGKNTFDPNMCHLCGEYDVQHKGVRPTGAMMKMAADLLHDPTEVKRDLLMAHVKNIRDSKKNRK